MTALTAALSSRNRLVDRPRSTLEGREAAHGPARAALPHDHRDRHPPRPRSPDVVDLVIGGAPAGLLPPFRPLPADLRSWGWRAEVRLGWSRPSLAPQPSWGSSWRRGRRPPPSCASPRSPRTGSIGATGAGTATSPRPIAPPTRWWTSCARPPPASPRARPSPSARRRAPELARARSTKLERVLVSWRDAGTVRREGRDRHRRRVGHRSRDGGTARRGGRDRPGGRCRRARPRGHRQGPRRHPHPRGRRRRRGRGRRNRAGRGRALRPARRAGEHRRDHAHRAHPRVPHRAVGPRASGSTSRARS